MTTTKAKMAQVRPLYVIFHDKGDLEEISGLKPNMERDTFFVSIRKFRMMSRRCRS